MDSKVNTTASGIRFLAGCFLRNCAKNMIIIIIHDSYSSNKCDSDCR